MSHGDHTEDTAGLFIPLMSSSTCAIAAVKHRTKPIYGLQFHPEVTHTEHGGLLLGNFVKEVCDVMGRGKSVR